MPFRWRASHNCANQATNEVSPSLMSQTKQNGPDNIMHCAPHVEATQNSFTCPVSTAKTRESHSLSGTASDSDNDRGSNEMHSQFRHPLSQNSGSSTPTSASSSTSYVSNASSSSSHEAQPPRSSMKPSLKTSLSLGENLSKTSPPIVRFADPEPMPKPQAWLSSKSKARQLPEPLINRIPNPLIKSQHYYKPTFSASTTDLTKQSRKGPVYAHRPVPRVSPRIQLPGSYTTRIRPSTSDSASTPQIRDPRWTGGPLPAHLPPPRLSVESRKPSHQSTGSTGSVQSVQSAPAILITPPDPALSTDPAFPSEAALPPAQYNPLQNYVPCLYPTCYSHYTPVHENPTHYMEPDPYNLARHHGYCARHAVRELREATALCKKELENLRQNAGRKTLGVISVEFDVFLTQFRAERKKTDKHLQRQQKARVLGPTSAPLQPGKTAQETWSTTWDWRYTPRTCSRAACHSLPYSPYANYLYAFYTTRRPSSFAPLQTLCPPCAKEELEVFEAHIKEIRASRRVWDKDEWNAWFVDAARDRDMELEFWSARQESGVRARSMVVCEAGKRESRFEDEEKKKALVGGKAGPEGEKKRGSVWKWIFGGR